MHSRLPPVHGSPTGRAVGALLRVSLLVAAAACAGGTTDPGRPGVPLGGAWRYAAQVPTSGAEIRGTLSVTQQTGAQFVGALDVVETGPQGLQRRLAGPMAGRTSDSTAVDFEVQLGGDARRHVGRVRGDSLTGTWVETMDGGAPAASGSFRAARQR